MATLIMEPLIERKLLDHRRACGGDKFDEVWDGIYVVMPFVNSQHQEIVARISTAFCNSLAGRPDAHVFAGVNISDRRDNWEHNYRCPDIAVVLASSRAVDCDTFYFGGPDFVVEIVSDYDRSREKFDFYARVGVQEMLLVDRNPWQLELYRLANSELALVGKSDTTSQQPLMSQALPLTFRLLPRPSARPQIEIVKPETNDRWLA